MLGKNTLSAWKFYAKRLAFFLQALSVRTPSTWRSFSKYLDVLFPFTLKKKVAEVEFNVKML